MEVDSYNQFVRVVASYVEPLVTTLSDDFQWKLPKELPASIRLDRNKSLYDQTRQLKAQLRREVSNANVVRQEELFQWWVTKWGNIRAIRSDTLKKHSESIPRQITDKWLQHTQFTGIASWSKVASLLHPGHCPIFDARVAFSLNALNLLEMKGRGPVFPMPPGRNTLLKSIDVLGRIRRAQQSFVLVPKTQAYWEYVKMLRAIHRQAKHPDLDDLEMVLFTHAEALAHRIINAAKG